MRASKRILAALSLVAAVALTGCGSTKISSVWKDPAPSGTPFKKVMVFALAQDAAMRRIAEDTFVRNVPKNVVGIASYTAMGDASAPRDTAEVIAKLQEMGCDGAVVYRLVSVDTQTSYVPGTTYVTGYGYPYYGSFGGYYGYASSVAYSPGYLVEDQIIQIESNAYTVADKKLVWTARSESINPSSAQTLIDDVVLITLDQLRVDKILK